MRIAIVLVFLSLSASAQISPEGLDMDGDIEQWYDGQVGVENTTLILGTYQEIEYGGLKNNPFFGGFSWQKGSLKYRGQSFKDVFMMYDLDQDLLVIKHPYLEYANQPIRLFQGQVESFNISNHFFINLGKPSVDLPEGFFELLHDGKSVDLVCKRSKRLEIELGRPVYNVFDFYYLVFENQFFPYKRRGSFKKQFPELKKEIQSFSKENLLLLNAGKRDEHAVLMVDHIDKLLNEE